METFERFSVTKAVNSPTHMGLVARSERFEVWAQKYRAGQKYARAYHVSFSVVEVVSKEPRKVASVEVPETIRSNLARIIAHLEKI